MAGATPLPNSPQVQALRKIGATDEEIADVLACDKAIDRGADLFPLDPELEAGAKKRGEPTAPTPPKRRSGSGRKMVTSGVS